MKKYLLSCSVPYMVVYFYGTYEDALRHAASLGAVFKGTFEVEESQELV